jgi:TolA-binding protein
MMKRWMLICALPMVFVACSGEKGQEQNANQEESNYVKGDQSKEERQTEIAAMEKEISGLIRSERADVLDSKADRLLKRYRDYIGANPRDSITAEYLFKAADLSVGVGRYEGAINHLNRLNTDFPTFRKNVEMWLFKGFIYETYLNDHANAVKTYEAILERFPNHRLAADARASIENLSMSEEEMLEMFRKKNEAAAAAAAAEAAK